MNDVSGTSIKSAYCLDNSPKVLFNITRNLIFAPALLKKFKKKLLVY